MRHFRRRRVGSCGRVAMYVPAVMGGAGAAAPFYLAGGISPAIVKGVYVPYGAASREAALVNLDNPGTEDLVSRGADPGHAGATGFSFDGLSQYLQVGGILLDGASSVLMRVANLGAGDGHLLGCFDGAGTFDFQEASGAFTLTNGTAISGVTFAGTTGLAIAGTKAYRNGSAVAGTFTPIAAPLISPAFVGCWSNEGAEESFDAFDLLWMTVYSDTLSEAQVAAVYAEAPV